MRISRVVVRAEGTCPYCDSKMYVWDDAYKCHGSAVLYCSHTCCFQARHANAAKAEERNNTMSNQPLKPCPWCGQQPLGILQHTVSLNYGVVCGCGAKGPVTASSSIAETLWNNRKEEQIHAKS